MGALTTFRALEKIPTCDGTITALVEAARVVAGVQLRNLATIGGNIGNASPSADSVPPLVVLGATVEIASAAGTRAVPVEACITGPGRTFSLPAKSSRPSAFRRRRLAAATPSRASARARRWTSASPAWRQRSRSTRRPMHRLPHCPRRGVADAAARDRGRGRASRRAHHRRAGRHQRWAGRIGGPADSDIRGSASYRRAIVRVLTARVVQQAAARAAMAGAR